VQLVCIRARVGLDVGTTTEVPDGASYSDLYFAEPGTPEAKAALAAAKKAAAASQPAAPAPAPKASAAAPAAGKDGA
jgi:hypothetical protein